MAPDKMAERIALLEQAVPILDELVNQWPHGLMRDADDDEKCIYCGEYRALFHTMEHDPKCPIERGWALLRQIKG